MTAADEQPPGAAARPVFAEEGLAVALDEIAARSGG